MQVPTRGGLIRCLTSYPGGQRTKQAWNNETCNVWTCPSQEYCSRHCMCAGTTWSMDLRALPALRSCEFIRWPRAQPLRQWLPRLAAPLRGFWPLRRLEAPGPGGGSIRAAQIGLDFAFAAIDLATAAFPANALGTVDTAAPTLMRAVPDKS